MCGFQQRAFRLIRFTSIRRCSPLSVSGLILSQDGGALGTYSFWTHRWSSIKFLLFGKVIFNKFVDRHVKVAKGSDVCPIQTGTYGMQCITCICLWFWNFCGVASTWKTPLEEIDEEHVKRKWNSKSLSHFSNVVSRGVAMLGFQFNFTAYRYAGPRTIQVYHLPQPGHGASPGICFGIKRLQNIPE